MKKRINSKILTLINSVSLCGVLCLIMTCLSGCVNIDTNITIDRQGNATLDETVMIVDELLSMAEVNPSDKVNEINSMENPEIKAELISETGSSGVKITKKIQNIQKNDINNRELFTQDKIKTNLSSGRFVDVEQTFFYTAYNLNFDVDLGADSQFIKGKLTITIPVEAENHNATNIIEKEHRYIWKIDSSENNVSLSYSTLNVLNIMILVLIVVVALFSVGFFIFRKNNL